MDESAPRTADEFPRHSAEVRAPEPPAPVAEAVPGTSRDLERSEIRKANAKIWQPSCHLLWQPDGTRWTKTGVYCVVFNAVSWARSVFNLYAMLHGWEHRPAYGLMIVPHTLSCVLTYFLFKIVNPRTGELVQMCSFQPATDEEIAANHKAINRSVVIAAIFAVMGAGGLCLVLFTDTLDSADIRLQHGEYGGHGGQWTAVGSHVLELLAAAWLMFPVTIMFVYTLKLASAVSVTAARYVTTEIDKADRDIETNVSEALRAKVGPCVQTLVEEMLVPLSSGWGPPVALMAVICVGLSFLSLPTLIDVNSTDAERQDATSSCIFMALCAVAVVYPPAKVTTACEDMKLMLNDLRTAGVGTGHGMIDQTTDADISVIETWLCNLNDGQGPGFLLFETVVNKRLLLTLASKVAAYVVLAVQALQQLQQPQSKQAQDVAPANRLGIGTYVLNITEHGVTIVGPS